MKRKLQTIAMQLSEDEIQELVRIKKMGDRKTVALRKKRDKLAAQLAALDAQIAENTGQSAPAGKPRRAKRKPAAASKKTAAKAKPKAKATTTAKTKKRGRRVNLSAAVRDVFARAGAPLRAKDVVDGLPGAGVKVSDVSAMRKRISVVLASQKNHFEQVERGVYQLIG